MLADGVERGILTVNRMIPGPSIQVCEGDRVVVDVENHMEGMEVTIHWHGILQKGTQYYDGVPFITQCPIQQGNTFRYANDDEVDLISSVLAIMRVAHITHEKKSILWVDEEMLHALNLILILLHALNLIFFYIFHFLSTTRKNATVMQN